MFPVCLGGRRIDLKTKGLIGALSLASNWAGFYANPALRPAWILAMHYLLIWQGFAKRPAFPQVLLSRRFIARPRLNKACMVARTMSYFSRCAIRRHVSPGSS